MRRLLSRIFGRTSATRGRQMKRRVLEVEGLESRWCPAVTVGVSGQTLSIIGDNAANQVAITQDDSANTLTVVADGVTSVFNSNQINKLVVNLKGGDDLLFYGLATNVSYSYGKEVDIKLGNGHDECLIDFRGGGIGGTSWVLSSLDIDVNAGNGNDTLIGHFNGKHGGVLNVTAKMGNGNDEAFVSLWSDVTGGADVLFDLQGGNGNDWLHSWNTFDNRAYSYGSIGITHDSSVVMKMNGGNGHDIISMLYAGELDGDLTFLGRGGKGNDEVSAALFLPANADGELDAKIFGDRGHDLMDFYLEDNSAGDVNIIAALLHGNQGFDTCTATPNVAVFGCEG